MIKNLNKMNYILSNLYFCTAIQKKEAAHMSASLILRFFIV